MTIYVWQEQNEFCRNIFFKYTKKEKIFGIFVCKFFDRKLILIRRGYNTDSLHLPGLVAKIFNEFFVIPTFEKIPPRNILEYYFYLILNDELKLENFKINFITMKKRILPCSKKGLAITILWAEDNLSSLPQNDTELLEMLKYYYNKYIEKFLNQLDNNESDSDSINKFIIVSKILEKIREKFDISF